MKVHLYRLPPFKKFGAGWLILNEQDQLLVLNDENIPELKHIDLHAKHLEYTVGMFDFIKQGERPQILVLDVTLEEAYNYIQMEMLLE